MKRDPYKVLGIEKNASDDQIKKAYRKLAVKFHPDKNPDNKIAEEKFLEASEAYEAIATKEKREGLKNPFYNSRTGTRDPFDDLFGKDFDFGGYSRNPNFWEAFNSTFERNRRRHVKKPRKKIKSDTLEARVKVTLSEIKTGTTKALRYNRKDKCSWCGGTGAKDQELSTCMWCKGSGSTIGGAAILFPCAHCKGTGDVPVLKCDRCGGLGYRVERTEKKIKIPPGIMGDTFLEFRGAGNFEYGHLKEGDLKVYIIEEQHPGFIREGADLHGQVSITCTQAVLGCEKQIELFDKEKVKLKIPALSTDFIYRLKGKGLPILNSNAFGSVYIEVNIMIPQDISNKEKDLYEKIRELEKDRYE